MNDAIKQPVDAIKLLQSEISVENKAVILAAVEVLIKSWMEEMIKSDKIEDIIAHKGAIMGVRTLTNLMITQPQVV